MPRVTHPPAPAGAGATDDAPTAPFLTGTVDVVIHERLRLAIVHALALHPALTFTELKRLLGMTDGNLSIHAKRLEEVGYVESRKTMHGRTTQTRYTLTPAGRRALSRYVDHLQAIVDAVRPSLQHS